MYRKPLYTVTAGIAVAAVTAEGFPVAKRGCGDEGADVVVRVLCASDAKPFDVSHLHVPDAEFEPHVGTSYQIIASGTSTSTGLASQLPAFQWVLAGATKIKL